MSRKTHRSQEDRILQLLQTRVESRQWTPARELSLISLQYCRAIDGLRKRRGFVIENRTETHDGVKHGFYRLVGRRVPVTFVSRPLPSQPTNPISLFGAAGIPARSDKLAECSRHEPERQRGLAKGEGRG